MRCEIFVARKKFFYRNFLCYKGTFLRIHEGNILYKFLSEYTYNHQNLLIKSNSILKHIMTKFPKLRTLTGNKKSKKLLGQHNYPKQFSQPISTPRTVSNSWTRKKRKFFFAKQNFSFFALFLNSMQFKHFTPSIMVSLSFSTLTIPILIRNWGPAYSQISRFSTFMFDVIFAFFQYYVL